MASLPPVQKVIEGQIQYFRKREEIINSDCRSKVETCAAQQKALAGGVENGIDEGKVREALSNIDDWNMDVFALAEVTLGHPLYYISLEIFQKRGFMEKFNLSAETLHNFLCAVEGSYRNNIFHNRTHAADVTHAMNCLLNCGVQDGLSDMEVFAAITAAIVHDVDHPGTSNAFQVAIQSEVAIRYNDKSVLENHHLASAFSILLMPECNITSGLSKEQFMEFREILIAVVLATDLANHFDLMNKWKLKLGTELDMTKKDDKILAIQMAIKLADVNNQAKTFSIAERWSNLVVSEFFEQGDVEREKNMKISPNCDRHTVNMPKSQVGFIDFIVKPLFENVATHYTKLQFCVDNINANKETWKARVSATPSSTKPSTPVSGSRSSTPRAQTPGGRTRTPAKKVRDSSSS